MSYIHYLGGEGRNGNLISIAIGMSTNPEARMAELNGSMPFTIKLLGLELGSQERLAQVKTQFRALHIKGPWFKPAPALDSHIKALEEVVRSDQRTKRVSLDLSPEEFTGLELMLPELGETMKSKALRRALRFYRAMLYYKAQGYMIQAVKGGLMVQFPDLDDVRGPLAFHKTGVSMKSIPHIFWEFCHLTSLGYGRNGGRACDFGDIVIDARSKIVARGIFLVLMFLVHEAGDPNSLGEG